MLCSSVLDQPALDDMKTAHDLADSWRQTKPTSPDRPKETPIVVWGMVQFLVERLSKPDW